MEESETGPQTPQEQQATENQQAIDALKPQKMPFDKKWWQLPKSVYIVVAVVTVISIGSTAYLFFAPSSKMVLPSLRVLQALPTETPAAPPVDAASIPSPMLTETPTPIPYKIESWKTYTNSTYGYSIKYSPDWKVTDLGTLEPKVPSYVTFNPSTTASPSSSLSVTVAVSTRTFDDEKALRATAKTAFTLNGLQASKTEEKDSNGNIKYNVVVKGTKYTYILVGKKAHQAIFDLMYPTFKTL
ncbi:MAG: hypothetical protein HYV40_02295 [Candidatus Levybacteria bacterium]|nr:hypothetical protein [Candidatus Levybacteria bacterium]